MNNTELIELTTVKWLMELSKQEHVKVSEFIKECNMLGGLK